MEMKKKVTGTKFEYDLEGAISESHPLFKEDVRQATEVVLDFANTSYMNSVGVKSWIQWTIQIPARCNVTFKNCTELIANQVSNVKGFAPEHTRVESVRVPFVCEKCSTEKIDTLMLGTHYNYVPAGTPLELALPAHSCPKCKAAMEPDFIEERLFGFLWRSSAA